MSEQDREDLTVWRVDILRAVTALQTSKQSSQSSDIVAHLLGAEQDRPVEYEDTVNRALKQLCDDGSLQFDGTDLVLTPKGVQELQSIEPDENTKVDAAPE